MRMRNEADEQLLDICENFTRFVESVLPFPLSNSPAPSPPSVSSSFHLFNDPPRYCRPRAPARAPFSASRKFQSCFISKSRPTRRARNSYANVRNKGKIAG